MTPPLSQLDLMIWAFVEPIMVALPHSREKEQPAGKSRVAQEVSAA